MTEILKRRHGRVDISCQHGSRFIWWYDKDVTGKFGDWVAVVLASTCECGYPPLPFRTKGQMEAYLRKPEQRVLMPEEALEIEEAEARIERSGELV